MDARASENDFKAQDNLEKDLINKLIICQVDSGDAVRYIDEIDSIKCVDLILNDPFNLSDSFCAPAQFNNKKNKALKCKKIDGIKPAEK